MSRLSRPTARKLAAIISGGLGLVNFLEALPYLAMGATAVNNAADVPPYSIVLLGFTFAILRVIGAGGAWYNKRWGVIVTILANAFDMVAAAPGILFAPNRELWFRALVGSVIGIVVIILCLWRERKSVVA